MGRVKLKFVAIFIAGTCGFATAAATAEDGSENDGQLMFNNYCRTCHTTEAGDNRLGPNLNGIIGRKAGGAQGFGYSSALESADFEWTAEKLDQFIADPELVVPGNNMKPYSGIGDGAVRAAIVSHLKNK